jgi:hypothetical protein
MKEKQEFCHFEDEHCQAHAVFTMMLSSDAYANCVTLLQQLISTLENYSTIEFWYLW